LLELLLVLDSQELEHLLKSISGLPELLEHWQKDQQLSDLADSDK
jgi:hypothetical protein